MREQLGLIERAKAFAIGLHNKCGQTYNGGPYEFHLQMVVDRVRKNIKYVHAHPFFGKNVDIDRNTGSLISVNYAEAVEAAAWCHDIVEDCGITKNDLIEATSQLVADIVFGVSDDLEIDRIGRRLLTLARTRRNALCVFVKTCDLTSNTSFSKESGSGMYKKYKREYPTVRLALKKADAKAEDWPEIWVALDELYEYDVVLVWLGEKQPDPNVITINIETATTKELQEASARMLNALKGK